jgi:hypothetical protein
MSDAFISLDFNWRYTYIWIQKLESFGKNPTEMIGKNIWEFPEFVGHPLH